MDAFHQIFAEDITWHVPGRGPLAGDYKGIDGVIGYFGRSMELSGGTFRVEVHDVLANDAHVVGLHTSTGEREGKSLHDDGALVFHVGGGKVHEVWQLFGDMYASEEFLA
jgi:ketosteroid isomerase-like protein